MKLTRGRFKTTEKVGIDMLNCYKKTNENTIFYINIVFILFIYNANGLRTTKQSMVQKLNINMLVISSSTRSVEMVTLSMKHRGRFSVLGAIRLTARLIDLPYRLR